MEEVYRKTREAFDRLDSLMSRPGQKTMSPPEFASWSDYLTNVDQGRESD